MAFQFPGTTQSHSLAADFCVVGGGLAGVCAALAAARNGARVILVQNRSVLGGNASSEIRMHVVGADDHGQRKGAREAGLIEELRLEDSVRNPQRSYPMWDLFLYEKVVAEVRITLLLDTECVGCEVEGGRIAKVFALRNSTDDGFEITARYFADCSGDGKLGFEAGAEFRHGRESQEEFGESLAVETGDRQTLGSSILFMGRQYDRPQPFVAPPWIRRFQKGDFVHRPVYGYEYGFWWAEWGGHLDTIKDNPAIRHELLRVVLGVWDYIKNSGAHPDSENWALDWIGALPGKRESRRFVGEIMLTQQMLEEGTLFPDSVAYGGWSLDLHPPEGVDAPDLQPCVQTALPHLYSIPLRALSSRNIANLFFAGRNISATHVAFASTRVMATCAVMGQAIGTAAAVGALQPVPPPVSGLAGSPFIGTIQSRLLKDDAFLPGLHNEDGADLARPARVSVSSQKDDSPGNSVLDGVTRVLPSHLGTWADGRTHRWESLSLPAWIELELPEAAAIGEIHLTFDSGFERELMLTASDGMNRKMIRGPQPETVSDYTLTLDGKPLLEVCGNYQRKRVHRLPAPVVGRTLRLAVSATHGLPAARLFEIRIY